jgi:ectoine hydroxylase-related dioxygenase (phytanoyl-CoA dioxygenase family)
MFLRKVKQLVKSPLRQRTLLRRYRDYLLSPTPLTTDVKILREAAFLSGGGVLDKAATMAKSYLPPMEYMSANSKESILKLDSSEISEAKSELVSNGFWIAPKLIDEEHLNKYQKSAESEVRNLLSSNSPSSSSVEDLHKTGILSNKEMVVLGNDFVLNQELVYQMATCQNILEIVGEYLGVRPILNYPDSWFSFPVPQISKMSAQNWHCDCDRIKWIKVFVYITDVSENNGPHGFVSTSHKNWKLKTENSRFRDDQIRQKFHKDQIKSFTAKRGTVIFEDTRGLHKGNPLNSGHRLILQLEFSTDSFGEIHPVFKVPQSFSHYIEKVPFLFPRTRYEISF